MRSVLFFRNFQKFTGGHFKAWNYFNHVLTSPRFEPWVWFSANSQWTDDNPWSKAPDRVLDESHPVRPNVFFLGGRDWKMLDAYPYADPTIPVINLVQHVRHAEEANGRFEYVERPAIRICVSEEVAEALRETGRTQGPLVVIPNGIDISDFPCQGDSEPVVDVLISAFKRPALGSSLLTRLERRGRQVELLTEHLPRPAYLRRLQSARVAIFLPNDTEGFYLPALEGMAAGALVVCPDVVGNRSFCLPGHNAFRPDYAVDEIVQAAEAALALPGEEARRLRTNALETAERFSLTRERQSFLDMLDNIDDLWDEIRVAEPIQVVGSGNGGQTRMAPRKVDRKDRKAVKRRVDRGHMGQAPNFIIIGTQKGGTTSLQRYLNGHPDVGANLKKEIHFFSWEYDQGLDWYLAHFPKLGKFAAVGESSPSYLLVPTVPERVHRILPDVKLIALLRNPIDRAYSQHQMNVARGLESLSFEEAIAQEPERLRGARDESDTNWTHRSYLTRGLYAEQLERWYDLFPREQLLVIKSEEFFARPEEGFHQTLAFLGLRPWSLERYEVHNRGAYSGMQPETRQRLTDYFAPHNQRLYDLLGRNLEWEDA